MATSIGTDRPAEAAAAIRHHYDVGNEFFRLWLDRSLTYSCAIRQDADDTLETARVAYVLTNRWARLLCEESGPRRGRKHHKRSDARALDNRANSRHVHGTLHGCYRVRLRKGVAGMAVLVTTCWMRTWRF